MSDKELEIAYELDYIIEDPAFFEPFEVMKPVGMKGYAWWSDRSKVDKLIQGFKMDFTVHEACILAAISPSQYKYFNQVHPNFVVIKSRLKGVLAIAAKQGLVSDIAHPQGFRSRQWFLERKQPKLYGRAPELQLPPQVDTLTTIVQRAFADKDGNIVISEKTAQVIQRMKEKKDGQSR